MSRKVTVLSLILFLLFPVSNVHALDNIKTINSEESAKQIIYASGDKLFLTKEWYGNKFEISPVNTIGPIKMQAVDSKEYLQALEEVQFPIDSLGTYDIYFLDVNLRQSPSILALSFLDGSVVVFGSYALMSKEKVHRLAVHELGHHVAFQLMDKEKWSRYLKLRGLENSKVFNDYTEIYENRPQEIFAEDFRLLFGGDAARSAAHLNSNLPSPVQIAKLKDFFLSLL